MGQAFLTLGSALLRRLPPETAHGVTLRLLESGLTHLFSSPEPEDPRLRTPLWDLTLPNPLGLAAGFDKDGRVPGPLLELGFGFVEIGTLTPRPQAGNPPPRLFRLPEARAIINRMGFNNGGHAAALARLETHRPQGVLGVNLGANRDSPDRIADYVAGIETFVGVADYFVINISSPNTPGLRDLQSPQALDVLLRRVTEKRDSLARAGAPRRPLALKLSPDIPESDLPEILAVIRDHPIDGLIIANTTLSRPGVETLPASRETGGLSGPPLFPLSTRLLAKVYLRTEGKLPLIGVGGVHSPETAIAKLEAGATALQLYTALVYEGPSLLGRLKTALLRHLETTGLPDLRALTGRQAETWASGALS